MRKKGENLRKMIPKRVEGQPSTGRAKGAQEGEALPKRGLVPELVGSQSNTLGGGPPRIVTPSELASQRGGRRRQNDQSRSLQEAVKRRPRCPVEILMHPFKSCQELPKPFPNPPKTLPKPSRNHPKATPNPPRRPLGAHVGPMFQKDMILNVQKTANMHPKVSKRRPRVAQTPPKLSSRPSQTYFWR